MKRFGLLLTAAAIGSTLLLGPAAAAPTPSTPTPSTPTPSTPTPSTSTPSTPTPSTAGASASPVVRPQLPVLAYYYIWFNASSWNRAKRDYPTVGRYSSDETTVMRKHIIAAKQAGITGFLVSWKDTPVLDDRLDKLISVAREQHFTLGIVYQGLDVKREPLPADRVRHDLITFNNRWGNDSVFDLYGRPLMIWAGTWRFSVADIRMVADAVRPHLQLLASERLTNRWNELGPMLDGNAYYWSSVDPGKDLKSAAKLAAMGQAVHRTNGLWIAPAAPGFDARLIGGTRQVLRNDGDTLRKEWGNALRSSPDALGLISWNEFTEGTYVEPSSEYGHTALKTLSILMGTKGPQGELDSSSPTGRSAGGPLRAIVIGVLLLLLSVVAVVKARRSNPQQSVPRVRSAP